MNDDDIDELTRQLQNVRLGREQALRAVTQADEYEREIIQRIRTVRRHDPQLRRNPHRVGDIVRITNTLRNEYGIVGIVTSSPPRLVTIRNRNTSRNYIRGWWNLELVHRPSSPTDDQQDQPNPTTNAQQPTTGGTPTTNAQ